MLDALVAEDLGIGLLPTVAEGNLPDTLALLEHLNDLPVVGVLVMPPYYFKPVETDGLRRFFERVLEVARHPVVGYHIPKYAVPVPADLVTSLPLWGVKDSAGDPAYGASHPGGRAGGHARHRGRPACPAARRGRGDLRAGQHRARAGGRARPPRADGRRRGSGTSSPPTCGGCGR